MTAPTSVRSRSSANQILLIKLTPGARSESRALASGTTHKRRHDLQSSSTSRRASRLDVLVIKDARDADQLAVAGRRHDLRTAGGRESLVRAIGLSGSQAKAVASVLAKAPADIRDELGQVARVLKWSDDGKLDVRRIVLSGHFDPVGVRGNQYGDRPPHNGTLALSTLRALVASFPVAAAKVRHLMVAACWSAGDSADATLARYKAVFPSLRSVTGYRNKAPRSGRGAERDLRRWARATSSNSDAALRRDRVFGRCSPKPAGRVSGLAHNRCGGAVYTSR
jgi:hypothetical protein